MGDTLDAAWTVATDALPVNWRLVGVIEEYVPSLRWQAVASNRAYQLDGHPNEPTAHAGGYGATPELALIALATKLSAR